MAAWDLRCIGPLIHVIPLDDLREHELTESCWCGVEHEDDLPHVVIHMSMDKREDFETGRRSPS